MPHINSENKMIFKIAEGWRYNQNCPEYADLSLREYIQIITEVNKKFNVFELELFFLNYATARR